MSSSAKQPSEHAMKAAVAIREERCYSVHDSAVRKLERKWSIIIQSAIDAAVAEATGELVGALREMVEVSLALKPPMPDDLRIAMIACKRRELGPDEHAQADAYQERWERWRDVVNAASEALAKHRAG